MKNKCWCDEMETFKCINCLEFEKIFGYTRKQKYAYEILKTAIESGDLDNYRAASDFAEKEGVEL